MRDLKKAQQHLNTFMLLNLYVIWLSNKRDNESRLLIGVLLLLGYLINVNYIFVNDIFHRGIDR